MLNLKGRAAKLLATIEEAGVTYLVFSQKRAGVEDKKKHGRLELLGGKIGPEHPWEGLIRELYEEERSGTLARKLRAAEPAYEEVLLKDTTHYVFQLPLTAEEWEGLKPAAEESLGFELISVMQLREEEFRARLTKRTRKTLEALGYLVKREKKQA